jgi:hypothetical protein
VWVLELCPRLKINTVELKSLFEGEVVAVLLDIFDIVV